LPTAVGAPDHDRARVGSAAAQRNGRCLRDLHDLVVRPGFHEDGDARGPAFRHGRIHRVLDTGSFHDEVGRARLARIAQWIPVTQHGAI
jgi:hypothetical protein